MKQSGLLFNHQQRRTLFVVLVVGALAVMLGNDIVHKRMITVGLVLAVPVGFFLLTRAPFTLFLYWLGLSPLLAGWGGLELGRGIPNVTVDRVLLGTMAIVVAIRYQRDGAHQRTGLRTVPSDVLFGMTAFLWAALGLLRSDDYTRDLQMLSTQIVVPYGVYYLTRLLVRDQQKLRSASKVAATVMVYLLAGAMYEMLTGSAIVARTKAHYGTGFVRVGSFIGGGWDLDAALFLLGGLGLFTESIAHSEFLGTVVRYSLIGALAVIFATFVRSAYMGALVVLLLAFVLFPRWRRAILVLMTIIGLGMLAFPQIAQSIISRGRAIGDLGTFSQRLLLMSSQTKAFIRSPWVGHGLEGQLVGAFVYGVPTSAHNTFLSMLMRVGLAGFVPWFLGVLWVISDSVRKYRNSSAEGLRRPFIAACWVGMAGYFVVANAVDFSYKPVVQALLFMLLALLTRADEILPE